MDEYVVVSRTATSASALKFRLTAVLSALKNPLLRSAASEASDVAPLFSARPPVSGLEPGALTETGTRDSTPDLIALSTSGLAWSLINFSAKSRLHLENASSSAPI